MIVNITIVVIVLLGNSLTDRNSKNICVFLMNVFINSVFCVAV